MSAGHDIRDAIRRLSRDELASFRAWFFDFDAEAWDRQLSADVAAGRLNYHADEAIADLRSGRCTDR